MIYRRMFDIKCRNENINIFIDEKKGKYLLSESTEVWWWLPTRLFYIQIEEVRRA